MKSIFIFTILILSNYTFAQQLRPENPGCPENAHCSKETGIIRSKWLEQLRKINNDSKNENSTNLEIQKNSGYPISLWTTEDIIKKNLPIIHWDSPCKQHKAPNQKFQIGEYFINNLSKKNIEKNSETIFAKVYLIENNKITKFIAPRGDAPLAIINGNLYYTKDDEGIYYGLHISKDGIIKISKTVHLNNFPKEVECKKEALEEFYRDSPTINFFKGQYCKDIWNNEKNNFSTILVGWSCN